MAYMFNNVSVKMNSFWGHLAQETLLEGYKFVRNKLLI